MADTPDHPPVLVGDAPVHLDRNGILPTMLRLRHHFFLTRFKLVVKKVIELEITDGLEVGLVCEMNNIMFNQGLCAALGISVPTPYWLQEYLMELLNFEIGRKDECYKERLASLLLHAEVSDRDEAFHDDIVAGEGEWWTSDEPEPLSYEYLGWLVTKRIQDLVNQGVISPIQSHPIPYADLQTILDTFLRRSTKKQTAADHPVASSSTQDPKRQSSRPNMDRMQRREAVLDILAVDLGLTSEGDEKVLSDEARVDLATFDELTRAQVLLQQMIGIEEETVNTESWNYDTTVQLERMADMGGAIPFGPPAPASGPPASASAAAPSASASAKGKQREVSNTGAGVYWMLPGRATEETVRLELEEDPLPATAVPEGALTFQEVMRLMYPEFFGDRADHYCVYRTTLFDVLRKEFQNRATQDLHRFLSGPRVQSETFGFWPPIPTSSQSASPMPGADSTPDNTAPWCEMTTNKPGTSRNAAIQPTTVMPHAQQGPFHTTAIQPPLDAVCNTAPWRHRTGMPPPHNVSSGPVPSVFNTPLSHHSIDMPPAHNVPPGSGTNAANQPMAAAVSNTAQSLPNTGMPLAQSSTQTMHIRDVAPGYDSDEETESGGEENLYGSSSDEGDGAGGEVVLEADTIDATFSTSNTI